MQNLDAFKLINFPILFIGDGKAFEPTLLLQKY
jgi:hypothetical protein